VKWIFEQDSELEFGSLKGALKPLVKRHFDHSFIVDKSDDFKNYLQWNRLRYYEIDGPPTTEAISAEIGRLSIERLTVPWNDLDDRPLKLKKPGEPNDDEKQYLLYPNVKLLSVELGEGPENMATWENPKYVRRAGTVLVGGGIAGGGGSTTFTLPSATYGFGSAGPA